MTKETILKKAEAWVNDGDWGYPDDRTGQWMFKKLVEAFTEGAKAMEEYREQRWVKLDKGDLLIGEWLVFWDSQDEEVVYDVVPYNREMPSRYTHWMRIEPPKD